MKIKEIISAVKTNLNKGLPSDNTRYSDRHIYFLVLHFRNKVLKQKLDKGHYINEFNYQYLNPFKVKPALIENCSDNDCYVLRSEDQIPKILNDNDGLLIKPYLNNKAIDIIPFHRTFSTSGLRYANYVPYAYIKDKYLYLKNLDLTLECITLKGLFEDPLEIADLYSECYDPYNEDFPLDSELLDMLLSLTYRELLDVFNRLPEDNENNEKHPEILNEKE